MARFAVIGRSKLLLDAARLLLAAGHQVPVVITCRPTPEDIVGEAEYAQFADEAGADYFSVQQVNVPEIVEALQKGLLDAAISVNWVSLVGGDVIASCGGRILNLHGGDLPRYRGNAPFAWAILQGEATVGLTVHIMDPHHLDAGPIVTKRHRSVATDTRIGDLYEWMLAEGPALLLSAAEHVVDPNNPLTEQSDTGLLPLRCYPRRPEDGRIDWSKTAEQVDRLVRASSEPFAGAYCEVTGLDGVIRVWRSLSEPWSEASLAVPGQVTQRDQGSGHVWVATGDGQLRITQVSMDGGQRLRPAELLKSTRMRLYSSVM